ncbi:hillarin-like isoform X1 [Mizuhopecten yessoensis]|uniref:Kyphoscoliosis peptidase n=1 Tax=Mizuhopecten yessoensis TaxID=6573 RepID=A0A210PGI1_MIZYE|nr:hillarin-like isoform X1 [Mizuhopecten yessoensis]OWF35614.1 Kyphoscoliosis peptidase [Mizuhopecten yessoensis]
MDDRCSSDGDDSECEDLRSLPRDPCYRCEKRVYPVEKVDVGVLFHRRCFRCRVCGLQMTLKTFHWDQENTPDVYCNVHLTRMVGSIDKDAMGIQSALKAPKRGINANEQIRGSLYNPGWQYDAKAIEFNHHRDLWGKLEKKKTSLGTYKDFESLGVFDAQSVLELRQKKEEDKLYERFHEDRTKMVQRLEDELKVEKEKSVQELVAGFEKKITSKKDIKTGLEKETERLEQLYKRKKEERLRCLMDKLTTEEKSQVTRLIEKHSSEMLLMIAEKFVTMTESIPDADTTTLQTASIDLSRPPPVAPPEFRRSQLFKSPEEFEALDNQVFEVAQKDYSAFTDLVKDLIQNCQTDLEKSRAIFRWITVKDLNKLEVDETVNPESPMGLLRGIKYGTESYHDLFKRLCSYAGLHCEVIQGLSKGAGYKPGMRMDNDKFRNSWTAVFIEGSWCFINCNWGARHVKGHDKDEKDVITGLATFYYRCDEFYFITDPEDHIHQHFPDDPKWQLLECPISLTEFINLPIVKSPFFNYGLKFANHYDGTQYTSNGIIVLQLKIPNLLGFGYTLDAKDSDMDPHKLEGRVMLRIIGHKAIFTVAPPKTGKYFLTIYAKEDWHSETLQSACAFRVKCREKRENIRSPFPKVPFFGPTPSMSQYGIVPQTHIDPLVVFSYDDVIFQFQIQKDVKLTHTLQYHGPFQSDITDFQRYVFVRYRDEKSISYQVRCPIMGKFVFNIFGGTVTSPEENTGHLECLFRYLLDCKHPAKDKRPLPRACHRWFLGNMLEPVVGDIDPDKRVTFRVRAPLAMDVAMLVGDAWFHFKEIADSIWEGNVYTGKGQCKAKLYAKLTKERARFSPLVEFNIK